MTTGKTTTKMTTKTNTNTTQKICKLFLLKFSLIHFCLFFLGIGAVIPSWSYRGFNPSGIAHVCFEDVNLLNIQSGYHSEQAHNKCDKPLKQTPTLSSHVASVGVMLFQLPCF